MMGMSLTKTLFGSLSMIVLIVCSVVTVGYAIERSLYFYRSRSDSRSFMKALAAKMKGGDMKAAGQWCDQQKGAAPRVVSQCLPHTDIPTSELKQRFDTAIEMEQVEMERNLSVLGTMSNIGPLLGLYGTVVGIIRAFSDIARTGSGGSAVVAMGVSEALLTTAAGIIVAVIATVCFNLFVRRIRTRIIELEDVREEFFNVLRGLARQDDRPAARVKADKRDVNALCDAVVTTAQEPAAVGR
ncbi:MAG: MotA/TolQ/ExbB proton channel family protein [Candidatus Latescibacteria bacterium]|nr:MotA/TolQ/ExbB proton channel family protein [Candidatus Latescibacterota bacterium]